MSILSYKGDVTVKSLFHNKFVTVRDTFTPSLLLSSFVNYEVIMSCHKELYSSWKCSSPLMMSIKSCEKQRILARCINCHHRLNVRNWTNTINNVRVSQMLNRVALSATQRSSARALSISLIIRWISNYLTAGSLALMSWRVTVMRSTVVGKVTLYEVEHQGEHSYWKKKS